MSDYLDQDGNVQGQPINQPNVNPQLANKYADQSGTNQPFGQPSNPQYANQPGQPQRVVPPQKPGTPSGPVPGPNPVPKPGIGTGDRPQVDAQGRPIVRDASGKIVVNSGKCALCGRDAVDTGNQLGLDGRALPRDAYGNPVVAQKI